MVELSAVNRSVVGSNPTCGAMAPGQAVKTPPFHGGNTGSSPVGVIQTEVKYRFFFIIIFYHGELSELAEGARLESV